MKSRILGENPANKVFIYLKSEDSKGRQTTYKLHIKIRDAKSGNVVYEDPEEIKETKEFKNGMIIGRIFRTNIPIYSPGIYELIITLDDPKDRYNVFLRFDKGYLLKIKHVTRNKGEKRKVWYTYKYVRKKPTRKERRNWGDPSNTFEDNKYPEMR